MFGYAWLRVIKFCECVVRCLCVQVLSRGGGQCGCVCTVKCRNLLSVLYGG